MWFFLIKALRNVRHQSWAEPRRFRDQLGMAGVSDHTERERERERESVNCVKSPCAFAC
jgi:hypothetical protein